MTGFTPDEAFKVVDEAAALLARGRQSLSEGRYVEADAWVSRVAEVLSEQDVLADLAAGEMLEATAVPPDGD